MIKMEGRLLNLGTVDSCGRKFAEDCKITFPNKVPVCWNFNQSDPRFVIGDANVFRDDKGLACKVNLTTDLLTEDEYYVGGYYTNVKKHNDKSICIIDACTLRSMSIVTGPADKSLKIKKEVPDD